jgi:HD-like signal output (HDOD) protein
MTASDSSSPPSHHRKLLHVPLRDLDAWTRYFRNSEIPIQAGTAEALEDLRLIEDDVDANMLGDMIASDPLMSLKVLSHVSQRRSARIVTDPETVTAALVFLGISPFFRAFGPQPTVEEWLADQPEALEGLNSVMKRAYRAATFALGFAVHRMDQDAAVIYQAALLHDFAEMLLWVHAPTLALTILDAQRADSTLRSSTIQKRVLNIELPDLQQSLMKAWRLPELLIRISDDSHVDRANVRNVILAIKLARHSAHGWDNAALPDDISDISQLLNLSPKATLQLVRDIDPPV